MGFTCVTDGMDELNQVIDSLGNAAQGAASMGLFEAAGVYADEVSKAIDAIAVSPFKYASRKKGETRYPSPEEKAILKAAGAAGIAKFKKNGVSVNTSIGFNNAGYAPVTWQTKRHKGRTSYKWNGKNVKHASKVGKEEKGVDVKPIPVIANAINSGTGFMRKQPFFRKATSRAKVKAADEFERAVIAALDSTAKIIGRSGHIYSSKVDWAANGWKYGD